MDKEAEKLKEAAKQRLKTMLDDLNEARRWANEDLSGWDKATANGAMIRKREAEEQVVSLTAGYRAAIENCIVKVFVTGERAAAFAEAMDRKNAITVDGSTIYREFAKAVEPSMDHKQRQFTTTQLLLLMQVMQPWMAKRKVYALNRPTLEAADMDVVHKDSESVVETVRKSFRNANNDDVLLYDLTERVMEKVVEKQAATLVVPVLITGVTDEETQSLQKKLFGSQPNVSVEATNSNTDEDLIKEINEKIQAVLNPKK